MATRWRGASGAWSYPEGLPATSVNQIVTLDLNNFDPQNPAAAERIIANTSSTLHRSDISISGDVVVWEDWRNNSEPPDPLFANANVDGMGPRCYGERGYLRLRPD